MQNLAYIARAIPAEQRREELPIAYHDAVCAIKDEDTRKELLDKAIEEDKLSGGNLTVPQFREMVKPYKEEEYAKPDRVIEHAETEICNCCGSEVPKPRGT
jgi:hypothetical protein